MCGGSANTSLTPVVSCEVTAVIAEVPYTPSAANVLRSAWIPAPAIESLPAMVRAARMPWTLLAESKEILIGQEVFLADEPQPRGLGRFHNHARRDTIFRIGPRAAAPFPVIDDAHEPIRFQGPADVL